MRSAQESFRKAVLLVAFGTGVPEAQKALECIRSRAAQAFPGTEIRWAFTSRVIRAKMARRGEMLDSPELALARLKDEGFSHVAVLSLHVFPGREFHDLHRTVTLFTRMAKGFRDLAVAMPLLSSYEDLVRTARGLLLQVPAGRRPEDAVLFMGHGNQKHPADMVYAAMNHVLSELSERVHVGTVQGRPNIHDLLPRLRASGVRKAWLIPFMTVAGEHAREDMAGEGPTSWKSVLAGHGIDSQVQMSGIAENPAVVDIWLDHLREAMDRLDSSFRRIAPVDHPPSETTGTP